MLFDAFSTRNRARITAICLILLFLPSIAPIAKTSPASANSVTHHDVCADPLERYVRAPVTRNVTPAAVRSADARDGQIIDLDAMLTEDGRGSTLSFNGGASPLVVLDFVQIVSGLLTVATLDSSSPELRIAVSESLRYLGPDSDTDWGDQGTTFWRPPAGPAATETKQQTFRYVQLSLSDPGQVTIDALRLYYTPFLGTSSAYVGCFMSSDDLINRIWYAGAYTLELNTVPTPGGGSTIVDGAKRDRLTWTADLAVQALVEYATHNRPEHVRYALGDLAAHQRPDGAIPPSPFGDYSLTFYDYCAWWVVALSDYYEHTGDVAFVTDMYPHLVQQMD